MATLGKHIRRARVEQGFSQGTLASKLGVRQATVSNWENDKGRPDVTKLKKMEETIGLIRPGPGKRGGESSEGEGTRAFGRWLEQK